MPCLDTCSPAQGTLHPSTRLRPSRGTCHRPSTGRGTSPPCLPQFPCFPYFLPFLYASYRSPSSLYLEKSTSVHLSTIFLIIFPSLSSIKSSKSGWRAEQESRSADVFSFRRRVNPCCASCTVVQPRSR